MDVKTLNGDLRCSCCIQGTNEKPVGVAFGGCCGKGDAFAVWRYCRHLVEEEVQFIRCGYLENGPLRLRGVPSADWPRSRPTMRRAALRRCQRPAATGVRDCDVWPRLVRGRRPLSRSRLSILRRSPALCHRSSGDLARHLRTRRSNAGDAIGCVAETGGGLTDITATIRLAWLEPSKLCGR